jgi:hypothetical protein
MSESKRSRNRTCDVSAKLGDKILITYGRHKGKRGVISWISRVYPNPPYNYYYIIRFIDLRTLKIYMCGGYNFKVLEEI